MSGVDNLQGIDYQVSYSVLTLLKLIKDELDSIKGIKFESLTEEEEDLNIYRVDGTKEYIQIKKKVEGYHWTPSELKVVLQKFCLKNEKNVRFKFVSNGSGNSIVTSLKKQISEGIELTDELIGNFADSKVTLEELKKVLQKSQILTLEYSSNDASNPSKVVDEKIKEVLLSPSFFLLETVENAFNKVWKLVFDLSKQSKYIDINHILEELNKIGISVSNKIWLDLPELEGAIGRDKEITDIVDGCLSVKRVIVNGISGTGKTTTLAKVVMKLRDINVKTAWIPLNRSITRKDVIHVIASFFQNIGLEASAQNLLKAEIRDTVPRILNVLIKHKVCLIFDSIDKANEDVKYIVEKLLNKSLSMDLDGSIIISSINTINQYTEIDVLNKKVLEYKLYGLSIEDTEEFFVKNDIDFDRDSIIEFHDSVGGHPISLIFLKELVHNSSFSSDDINYLSKLCIENARKWLFEKVYSTLSEDEQKLLLNSSIFNYEFNDEEVMQVFDSKYNLVYVFDSLIKKNIVSNKHGLYYLHDAIRKLACDILGNREKSKLHSKLAIYRRGLLEHEYREKKNVSYENIFKWGYHLENTVEQSVASYVCASLMECNSEQLDALWAIERFGYPFSYGDNSLNSSKSITKVLLKKSLIQRNLNMKKKYFNKIRKYSLKGFGFFDSCFLSYLCLSREISNHLGYIPIFVPNAAFQKQGIICPWEHCIEYMPLPPVTKAEHQEHLNYLQKQFENNAYDNKPIEIREMLWNELQNGVPEDAPEYPDYQLEAKSCPIFGHCCPGGKEQAISCREN